MQPIACLAILYKTFHLYTGEYYLHFDGCTFNDCASIAIGDVVEIRQPFILRLESESRRDDRPVDMSGAEAMVIFEEDGM